MIDFRMQMFGVAAAGWWLAMVIPCLAAGEVNLHRGKQVYEKY